MSFRRVSNNYHRSSELGYQESTLFVPSAGVISFVTEVRKKVLNVLMNYSFKQNKTFPGNRKVICPSED